MSVIQKDIVDDLKNKVQKIMALYADLKQECTELKNENQELKTELKNKESEVDFLKNKYNKLKLAKSISVSANDSHDAKIKINRIVREIDKCIALLNR